MATTDNNPQRYPSPRKLSRSMERAGNLISRPKWTPKAAPLAEKIVVEVVKAPAMAAFKAKLARGFQALGRVFKGSKGR